MRAVVAYLHNVGAAVSHLLNALTGGSARHSFSARVGWRAAYDVAWAIRAELIVNAVLFSRDHCREQAREAGLIPADG